MAEAVRTGDLDLAFVGLYAEQLPPGLVHQLLVDEPLVPSSRPPIPSPDTTASRSTSSPQPVPSSRCGASPDSACKPTRPSTVPGSNAPWRSSWARPMPSPATPVWDSVPGWVPASTARTATRVEVLPLDDRRAPHPIGLVHRVPAPETPSARAFLAVVLGTDGELPAGAREGSQPRP
jgi:DNA-binding transcriptional LysR family regulator